jgi:MATE family multidrug resistance protein
MGDETRARRVTRNGAVAVGDLCGVAVCSFMYSEAVLLAMGQEAAVATQGGLYLRIAVLGMFPG